MRLLSLLALAGFSALSTACVIVDSESTDEWDCALSEPSQRPATVMVLDGDGNPLCGARVVARDGAYQQELSRDTTTFGVDSCHAFTMPNRPGFYELTVEAPGFRTEVKSGVAWATQGYSSCAGPERVRVRLEREVPGCDLSAVFSFQVDLRDERGAPVCDANVVVRDGTFSQQLRGTSSGNGCFWDGPTERPGTYEVTISKPGYETVVLPAVVVGRTADSCHVLPGAIKAQLKPGEAACTGDIVESLALNVRDESGAPVCDARVFVSDGAFSTELAASGGGDLCFWSGLPERSGVYDVSIRKPGYETVLLENVIVTADQCHVKQVSLDVELTPLAVPPTE